MQVLQVTPRYLPNLGGVETFVARLSELLVEKGCPVTVYSLDLDMRVAKEQSVNGVHVRRFKPLVGDPLYLPPPSFIKAIKRDRADIIHIHNAHTLLPTFVALSKKRQKLILQPHYHKFGQTRIRNFLLSLYKHSLNDLVFTRTDFVIANSPYEEKIIHEDFPNCRNVILLREALSLTELQSMKWTPKQPTRILYVGTLRKYKNVGKLLEAFAYLVKTRRKLLKLVIVGDGPERKQLESRAAKIGIQDYVDWKRNLSRQKLLKEYSEAGVFVSLSNLESFSRVIHEAILIGIPTVVRNSGATANIVEKRLAEGVDSLNPRAIAGAILRATKRSPPQVGKNQSISLSWEEYSDKILEIYRKIINKH
ncbi:MAG: glycosyltransferase family 4 protein [Candidatus Bathyarchaeota archaeon]|nr:MAG: glycosyltransferase family 4 protein [Candidatus Bathyarchaeota archaeon]